MDWFVWKDNAQVGPLSDEAIQAMAQRGDLQPSTLLWHADLPKWTVAAEVPGLDIASSPSPSPSFVPPSPSFAASSGPKLFGARAPQSSPAGEAFSRPSSFAQPFAVQASPEPAYATASGSGPSVPLQDGQAVHMVVRGPAGPWARFWARTLDVMLASLVLGLALAIVAPGLSGSLDTMTSGLSGVIFTMVALPLAMVVDAGIYAIFGNTLGKLIAGIKVWSTEGQKLSFSAYLFRNLGVYVQGYALGIPLVNIATMIYCWRKVAAGETLRWDVASNSQCYSQGSNIARNFVVATVWFVIIFLISVINRAAGV